MHLPDITEATTHWIQVDSGSMINIVYSGVLGVFPELNNFFEDFQHQVTGVGNKVTKIVGKLTNVPLKLGAPRSG